METRKTLKIALKAIIALNLLIASPVVFADCICICQNGMPKAVCESSYDLEPFCGMDMCPMPTFQGMKPYNPYQPTQPLQPDNSDPYHMRNNFGNPWGR